MNHTVKEVAEELKLSEKKVRSLIASGRLRAVDVGSGSRKVWRIKEEWLEEFIQPSNLPSPKVRKRKITSYNRY